MNLVIDFGNTRGKAGIFEQEKLLNKFDSQTLEDLNYLIESHSFDKIFVSTVSLGKEEIIKELRGSIDFLTHQTKLPFTNNYKSPETLGLDRIAGVAGAQQLFPENNCLVIDMGTCITYDLLTSEGIYHGGGISPGVDIRFKSLNSFTAGLPLIKYSPDFDLIGKTTNESILSGIIYGIQAEIEGIIQMYREKFGDLKIILCGGSFKLFENRLKETIFAAPELVLIGLNRILMHHAS